MVIEHHELYKYIPHRHPFLLVDRVIEIEAFKHIRGTKCITGSESFFAGHFPEQPIMPGVLIIEAMAQLAAILATYSSEKDQGKVIYFAAIDNARFKKPVIPGDVITMKIDVVSAKRRMWKVKATSDVGGVVNCTADLTAMVAS